MEIRVKNLIIIDFLEFLEVSFIKTLQYPKRPQHLLALPHENGEG